MPYPSADNPIQYDPTGLFGPGFDLERLFRFHALEFVVRIVAIIRIGIGGYDLERAARRRLLLASDRRREEGDQGADGSNAFTVCRVLVDLDPVRSSICV